MHGANMTFGGQEIVLWSLLSDNLVATRSPSEEAKKRIWRPIDCPLLKGKGRFNGHSVSKERKKKHNLVAFKLSLTI
jgi:hypothetical protein